MPGLLVNANVEQVPTQESRQRRLHELAQQWSIDLPPLPAAPLRPEHPPSYRTESDVLQAEELLKHQRAIEAQESHRKSGLSRAFTTKKKAWEYKEIYNALVSHVENHGSPGVAEALIAKLNLIGGNVNLAQKSRTSLLTRRKSLDLAERSRVLQRAVENRHKEMVEVLLPFADALSLDTALPIAFRNRDKDIVELLIRYGASAVQTADGQDAFRQACAVGGQADLVALILTSDGRPSISWLSQCMVDAGKVGCFDTVAALSQSAADGNFEDAAALKAAIDLGRKDIALVIVLGTKPPRIAGLNAAFEQLMRRQNINPSDKLAMVEILLCAGAEGEPVAKALVQASATEFLEMVELLVSYGASIEYEDAIAVRKAVSKSRVDLVRSLLNGPASFSSVYASECIEVMPKKTRFEERQALLSLLLRKGANGAPLDEALIDATEAGDAESVKLLLTPQFPDGRPVGHTSPRRGSKSMIFERHATASTDHKGALALELATKSINVQIARTILGNRPPSNDAMAEIFPGIMDLPRPERYQMAEAFVRAGLSGPCVDSALQVVINEGSSNRDERLIGLLLRSNADVNSNGGAALIAAVEQEDMDLLRELFKSKPTPQIAAKAFPSAMAVGVQGMRFQIVTMLLGAGAAGSGTEVSSALTTLLQETPVNKQLLQLLLQQGKADVNYHGGVAIAHAVRSPDPDILETVLALGRPTPESLQRALKGLGSAPSSPMKAQKLEVLLRRTSPSDAISSLLIQEVQNTLSSPPEQRSLAVIKMLLANGADINKNNGEALCRAVAAASTQVVDLLFSARPNANSLAFTMPHALRIKDSMDRLVFARKILEGGIPAGEANRALQFAINTYPDDMPLVNTLFSHADTTDGLALIQAVKSEKQDLVELILGQTQSSHEVLNMAFEEAIRGKDRKQRSLSCRSLLKAGASGEVVSDALVAAASDGDLDLGTILVQNGGSVEHRNGQAVVEACQSGGADVLKMLLSGKGEVTQQTLQGGFQAATNLSDLKKRAQIFKLLLQAGVTGEVVDAQLVSAERYGDDGTDLVRLLLAHGASPDYNNGEAVEKAAQSAFLGNLEMLLGLVEVGEKQKKPSRTTLARAVDACWQLNRDTRYTILQWVFKAGRPKSQAVHTALAKAVAEENPEERLIQLLVANRASPAANGCQTLIEATRTLSLSSFQQLLESKTSSDDASVAFEKAFCAADVNAWLTERGLGIAQCLLEKGAHGKGVGTAFVAVLGVYARHPGEVSDDFVELLLKHGANVNYNHGEALQNAAAQGHIGLLRRLLEGKPSSESLTLAFPRIFDAKAGEDEIYEIINLFTEYTDGQNRVDFMFVYPGEQPVMVRALSQFPRSTKILEALLDVGYYHDQMTSCKVVPEMKEDEQVTLLMWALLQPQKKISSGVVNLLIDRGAKVNFETQTSHSTPLMIAIQTKRPDIVKSLLLAGAEVDPTDINGRSPLSMASAVGGELAITMMASLLAAGASRNDGSLHNAARQLNLPAMQVLVEYRHDPDFPSLQHGGRSALAELCLHAADQGPMTGAREKQMEKCIDFLMQNSDLTIQSNGKSALLLAFESKDPYTTTKVLLHAGMWKHINESCNQYTDGQFIYSPTQYLTRVLPQSPSTPRLLTVLRSNRCKDIFYSTSGPQPDDAIGLPASLLEEEHLRRARQERLAHEDEDHARALARTRELAALQSQIWTHQASIEDARQKRLHSSELSFQREKARMEEELFAKALAQQRTRQNNDLQHQKALTDAEVEKGRKMLQYERDAGSERVGNANQLSSLRLREREENERFDKMADARFKERLREQKRLVESQRELAERMGSLPSVGGVPGGPAGRRLPIGFVEGEL